MPTAADNEGSAKSPADGASRGLDWFNLFVANIQTGFGPFIAVYLSSQSWTQTAIGLALSIGTVSAMASQVPAGALVDLMPNKTRVAAFSVLVFTFSALMFAIHPIPLFVYLAEILHGISSCTLSPAIAAMSLVIAGRFGMGLRLGRNARYAAIGNGVGAALMGACGQYVSERAVFFLTAALTLPALFTLLPLRRAAVAGADLLPPPPAPGESRAKQLRILTDRRLLIFCVCAMLFTFSNAPLLMLISGTLTAKGSNPSLLIAACIVLPQIVVAFASPAVGRFAERYGRRIVLIVGFSVLPLRCLIFATTQNPTLLVAVQVFDGVAGACFGIMVPLIVSDVAGRSGHFNLSLGAVGFGIGIGGTLSTPAAGWLADHFGTRIAFFSLMGIGAAAVLMAFILPETRPSKESDADAGSDEGGSPPSAVGSEAAAGAADAGPEPPQPDAGAAPGEARPKPPARRRA
ncbi:MAG: major Facilitator Superfamily protein [Gammaproteobacteria bacterium]|nr:major Facilitator Superfamily protein [Gammaproteobacteria bacterium]